MTHILTWSSPNEADHHATVWASEEDAYKQACEEILREIADWDMSDSDYLTDGQDINESVKKGDFKKAVSKWNSCDSNVLSNYPMYYSVYDGNNPLSYTGNVKPLNDSVFSTSDDSDDFSDEEEDCPRGDGIGFRQVKDK